MKKKIGALKISICAVFLALFAAPFLLPSAVKIFALQASGKTFENPQHCASCHPQNYSLWHLTNHAETVRKATLENVQGDFGREVNLEYNGVKVETIRDGENFFIKIGDENFKVEAVVGAKYIEQYVAEKNGELDSLPIAYNLTEKRWINLNDADFEKKTADSSRHWRNWKTDCAACHRSGENDLPNGFSDFGISCSACHGNAAEHLAAKISFWAKLGFQTEDKIVNPRNLSSDAAMAVCANCHARESKDLPKSEEIAGGKSSDNLVSAHQQNDFDSEKYWANGANKFSGSEYQSILRAVCYLQSKSGGHGIAGEKINCADCHSPHETNGETFAAAKSFNQNCIRCHSQFSDENSIAEHTKHQPNSEASSCVSCHQPETVYGRMRFERTHEISVPNPLLTVEKEVPNACNLCHTDKSANWAIASSRKLWAERFRDAEISPDKRFNQPEARRDLSSNDAFLRALAADSLRKHSDFKWSAPFLSEAYQIENSSLVRYFLAAALKIDPSNSPINH